MADYWKSQPKKFCTYCKCWIADNKPSIEFHERGKNHKENVIKKISEIKQKSVAKAKQDEKKAKEFAAMEEAALKAYEEDLKRLEGMTKPAPLAPVGPTIEERRARDEQKCKEMDAIEKHHAKRQWTKASSPEGYPYYYNTLTGETQWEKPEGFQGSSEKTEEQGAKSVWAEGVSDEGYTYYYNSKTGESRWEKPDDFESSVPSGKDEKDSSSIQDTAADTEKESAETEKESANQELEPEATSNETKSEENTTAEAPETKAPRINFQSKKGEQENNDKVSETDGQEEGTESKGHTGERTKEESQYHASKRPRRTNPYGIWEEVKQEQDPYENVDLELPNVEYDDPPAQLPDVPEEPKVKFKEKTITSLGDAVSGAFVFKKRRLDNVKSRNIRQRLNDQ